MRYEVSKGVWLVLATQFLPVTLVRSVRHGILLLRMDRQVHASEMTGKPGYAKKTQSQLENGAKPEETKV